MPNAAKVATTRRQIDSLSVQVDSARRDLARGSVENLRQRVEGYKQSVKLMRAWCPPPARFPT